MLLISSLFLRQGHQMPYPTHAHFQSCPTHPVPVGWKHVLSLPPTPGGFLPSCSISSCIGTWSQPHPSTAMSLTGYRLGLAEVITSISFSQHVVFWSRGLRVFPSILHNGMRQRNEIKPYPTAIPLLCSPTSSLLQLI